MLNNYTIQNYLTDYSFDPDATDDEIMFVAKAASEKYQFLAREQSINHILSYSASLEVSKNKTSTLVYNLN